jgi:integrase
MQLNANPHPAHPAVTSHTCRADNHNTHGNVGSERAHRPNRTRTRPHTASADRSRSYVTHLIEDGWDPRFVQEQVGHDHASTTSIYTCVSSDYRTRTLRRALDDMVAQALGATKGACQ